jgi:mannose-6-phosphate isomerase-like protein (cupin superfamily)
MARTTPQEVAAMRVPSAAEIEAVVVRPEAFAGLPHGPLTGAGVEERCVIGPANPLEGTAAGPLGWPHGFHLRRVTMTPGAATARHVRAEPEVVFVQDGGVTLRWDGGALDLGPGDTLTTPAGLARTYASANGAVLFVVRGGDRPAPPVMV